MIVLYSVVRLWISWHDVDGFPVNPAKQLQYGEWLVTWHSELRPQTPTHGSWHFMLRHALVLGQSEFITHSGRHSVYGSPKNSGRHVQDPALFCSWQTAFVPHGDGLHGFIGSGGSFATRNGGNSFNNLTKKLNAIEENILWYFLNLPDWSAYSESVNTKWMDRLGNCPDIGNLVDDYWQCMLYTVHMLHGTDPCIFRWHMLDCQDTQNSECILDDNLADDQYSCERKSKQQFHLQQRDTWSLVHMVKVHMDWLRPAGQLVLFERNSTEIRKMR